MTKLLPILIIAARTLRRSLGFTVVVVLVIALGIGATASVFSIAEPLLIRPLPVRAFRELVLFRTVNPASADGRDRVPEELFHRFSSGSATLSGVLGSEMSVEWTLELENESRDADSGSGRFQVEAVTGSYFRVLGIDAAVGRTLSESDEQPEAPLVAVISHGLWQRRFGGSPDIIGTAIGMTVPGAYGAVRSGIIVVGVAPPGFYGVDIDRDSDIWVPFRTVTFAESGLGASFGLRMMGRMRPGVELGEVQAEAGLLSRQLVEPTFSVDKLGKPSISVEPGGRGYSELRFEFSDPVLAMAGAAALVLLLVWTNVVALMLTRSFSRRSEMVLRLALGSRRSGLLSLFLAEGLILAFVGGVLGLALAYWGTAAMTAYLPPTSDLASRAGLGRWTLLMTCCLSIVGVMVLALLPGLKATSRSSGRLSLTGGPRPLGRGGGFLSTHRVIVTVQIALSIVLVAGAVLLLRTLANLRSVDAGFDVENMIEFRIEGVQNVEPWREFARSGLPSIEALPGVQAATFYGPGPGLLLNGPSLDRVVSVTPGGDAASATAMTIGPRFLETTGIPLIAGRTLRRDDGGSVVLSRSLADHLFRDSDPVGRTVFVGRPVFNPTGGERRAAEVVGVVGDIRQDDMREPSQIIYYRGAEPWVLAVRSEGNPALLAPGVRRVVEEFHPDFRVTDLQTLSEVREALVAPERLVGQLAGVFGIAAIILATIGIYGLSSYTATRRTPEIGIRIALGAQRGRVVGMLMREMLSVLGVGAVLGLLAAVAFARLLSSFLSGVTPMDPLSLVVATLAVCVASLLAACIPANCASRVDPMVSLRHD